MSALTIPLISIYEYDSTILDDLHVPTEADLDENAEYISPIPVLSDSDLHMELLFQIGEMSPVYTDPELLKKMVEVWARINKPQWVQLWQTTLYKYNPIWNKDGTKTETRTLSSTGTNSGNRSGTSSDTEVLDGEVNTTASSSGTETKSGTSSQSNTHSVTGYDTNSLSPASSDSGSGTTGENNSNSSSGTGKELTDNTITRNGTTGETTSGSESLNETETFTHQEQGNIGVTTSQQMIKEQREIVTFNIYNYIIESFKKKFMVQVWDI